MTQASVTALANRSTASAILNQLFWNTFIAGIGAALFVYYFQNDGAQNYDGWRIVVLAVTTIAFIVIGPRFGFERVMEDHYWPGREAWASIIALCIALWQGIISQDTAIDEFNNKIDIILFILAFALLSQGLRQVGFIHFAAYYIVRKCQGNTTRLVLYLYILTSIFTFFTSNDIVTLVMTPIIIAVAMQAGIKNPKLLLLSQFVAANTLSMGLFIGSPSNIIVALQLGIDFIKYFILMIIPAVYSFFLSFAVVDMLNRTVLDSKGTKGTIRGLLAGIGIGSKSWAISEHYQVPNIEKHSHYTDKMTHWLVLFGFCVALVTVVTYYTKHLYWAAILTATLSLLLYYRELPKKHKSSTSRSKLAGMWQLLRTAPPYGILFFGITFFIFTKALGHTDFFNETIKPFVESIAKGNIGFTGMGMIFLSGVAVNFFNDLPASALIGEIFDPQTGIQITDPYVRQLVLQGILVGVNIGCYVTPVGALAGLIWFQQMAKEKKQYISDAKKNSSFLAQLSFHPADLSLPTRGDMIHYGAIHFVIVGVLLGFLLPFGMLVVDFFLEPAFVNLYSPLTTQFPGRENFWVAGIAISFLSFIWFYHVMDKYKIFLSHLRGIFLGIVHFQIWVVRNRFKFALLLITSVFIFIGTLLYFAETYSASIYDVRTSCSDLHGLSLRWCLSHHDDRDLRSLPFSGIKSFLLWFSVFVGSGFEQGHFPRSFAGVILVAFLPVGLLSALIFAFRSATNVRAQQMSERLATGAIPCSRVVIVNFDPTLRGLLAQLLRNKKAFLVVLCQPYHVAQTKALVNALVAKKDRIFEQVFVAPVEAQPDLIAGHYNLSEAEEIYLLDDGSVEGSLANLRHLALLDLLARKTAGLHNNDEDGFRIMNIRLPHIVMEAPTPRIRELVLRTVSKDMYRNIKIVGMNRSVAEFLVADARADVAEMNRFYRFDDKLTPRERLDLQRRGITTPGGARPANALAIQDKRKNLTESERRVCTCISVDDSGHPYYNHTFISDTLRLNEYALGGKSRKDLRDYFATRKIAFGPDQHPGDFIRDEALKLRAELDKAFEDMNSLSYEVPGSKQPWTARVPDLFGVSLKCAESRIRLSISSVSTSRKTAGADGVLLLQANDAQPPSALKFRKARVIVINVNHTAEAFVKELANRGEDDRREIVVFADKDQVVPRSINNLNREKRIQLIDNYSPAVRNIANLLLPRELDKYLDEQGNIRGTVIAGQETKFLTPGDFIYVFLKQLETRQASEGMSDELYSVDIIDRLMDRIDQLNKLSKHSGRRLKLSESDFYIAAEINNPANRFLFENLSVDDIFDSSWIRRSYFENLARAYHFPQYDYSMKQSFQRTNADFERAHEIASLLDRYVVVRAADIDLTDERGNKLWVAGEEYSTARQLIRNYSDPPMQLIGTCRLKLDNEDRVCLIPGVAQHLNDTASIDDEDLLVNVPIV